MRSGRTTPQDSAFSFPTPGPIPVGTLPRRAWVLLNRLGTGILSFRSCLHKWGMASSAVCESGAEEQTSTMLTSNVQSIDLLMDCMAWRFWTMRQSHGCSTPARDLVRQSSGLKNWLILPPIAWMSLEISPKNKWRIKKICRWIELSRRCEDELCDYKCVQFWIMGKWSK